MTELAKRLMALIETRQITFQDLADRAGVSRSLVGQISTGKIENPRLETLVSLARELGTSVSYLAGEVDSPLPFRSSNWLEGQGAAYAEVARKAYELGVPAALMGEIVEQLAPRSADVPDEYLAVIREAQEGNVSPELLGQLVRQLKR